MLSISVRSVAPTKISLCSTRKPRKPSNIFAERLDFSRDFDGRKLFSSSSADRIIKTETLTKGFKGAKPGLSDERVKAFDREYSMHVPFNLEAGGFEATLNSLSKWIVSATLISIVLVRHDPEALWACIGTVINSTLGFALKKMLNQERPVYTLRRDPGMPSSHSQSISYTLVFLVWSLVKRYGVNGFTTTLSGLLFIVGSYLSWLRVSQKLHTRSQIVVGAILGSVFSILWFWSWNNAVFNLFNSLFWARAVIILGAVLCLWIFISHVFKSWIKDE